jgi:glutamine synthetase
MAAIIKAVNEHGDLLRLAIANPGNDFRLGACEAPPSIISTYLGEDMTQYLESYRDGGNKPYNPTVKVLHLGAKGVAPVELPSEDRNRTSPFPYGGHRFEFRAVGSSQNVSMVNTVLASITAASFKAFSDAIEAGQTPRQVAQAALKDSWKVIFNGNGYDPANQKMLTESGLWRIDSGVEAMCRFTHPKNVALFEDLKVLTPQECAARQQVLLTHYSGTVEVEANCLVDMLNQQIIPAVKAGGVGPLAELQAAVETLKAAQLQIHHTKDHKARAELSRTLRLDTMIKIRAVCDAAEAVVPEHLWPLATYKELLFLDMNVE